MQKKLINAHKMSRMAMHPDALLLSAHLRDGNDFYKIVQAELAIRVNNYVYLKNGEQHYRYTIEEGVACKDNLTMHVIGKVSPF
jgi:hypothetical protein